ncbi:MAG TPA: hypothetical protein VFX64_00440, partial [Candidatus Nitrosotalea sp.]|nr:hypothetical protein [Candidatus Nitrosotalea sp.]
KVSDNTHQDISNLIHGMITSLQDDLDSPAALVKLEEICLEVKNGKSMSKSDYIRICKIFGIKS